MGNQIYFSFNSLNDVKSLSGFVRGGRDQVPKELSDYSLSQIAGWSEKEIKEHIEEVASKAKEVLDISARNFTTPIYNTGTGSFECPFFNYDFSVSQSEENLSKCVFTGLLEIQDLETFSEVQSVVDQCFDYSFDQIVQPLPKEGHNLKELIYSLDDNKKRLNAVFSFAYDNDFSKFHLVHHEDGTAISVNKHQVEINFKKSESIPKMIQSLNEVNENVFSAGPASIG